MEQLFYLEARELRTDCSNIIFMVCTFVLCRSAPHAGPVG